MNSNKEPDTPEAVSCEASLPRLDKARLIASLLALLASAALLLWAIAHAAL